MSVLKHILNAVLPLQTLCFNSTNIRSMVQFSALSSLRRLDNITIESDGNPVTDFLLWKHYLLFRLAHFSLKKINDVDVSLNSILFVIRIVKTKLAVHISITSLYSRI